jgi:hypothetical protein
VLTVPKHTYTLKLITVIVCFLLKKRTLFYSLRREDGPKEIEVTGIMTMIEEEDHLKDTVGDLLKMIIVVVEEAMTIVVVVLETIMDLLEEEEEAREVMVLHQCTADHQVQEMHMDHQEEEVDLLHPP